jgi:hopene-associated glycosyltransferase HpnB
VPLNQGWRETGATIAALPVLLRASAAAADGKPVLAETMTATTLTLVILGAVSIAGWLGLALGRGMFWRIDREPAPPASGSWPDLVAVIPARNEEAGIGETVRSLWRQEYPAGLRVVVVDDEGEDDTVGEALRAARESGREVRIVRGDPLPAGRSGKVWAMHQGITRGVSADDPATYILFSDADISHGPDSLRELVCRAEAGGYDLTSFMVSLESRTLPEKLMIPAFVFFFRMLYPFRLVNDPGSRVAGAAGGTMLVRRAALARIGGVESIKGELIDDCALGREIKRGGHRVWLGMSETSRSLRHYRSLHEVLHMISRSAYAQLGYSPLQVTACVIGLLLLFVVPPVLLLGAWGLWPGVLGGVAWLLMSLLYLPMVRFYHLFPLWTVLLPVTALLYVWATVSSAWHHGRGRGGMWKGRIRKPL